MIGGQVVSAMPTWDGFLLPVLRVLADGATLQARDLHEQVADDVGLSDEQRAETIDSGQLRFRNRVGWAVSSLTRAEALARPRRATYTITDLGRRLLIDHPSSLDEAELRQIPAYRDHQPATRTSAPNATPASAPSETALDPLEQINAGVARLRAEVAAQLLERLRAASPDFLEQSVLDVLVAMGYGGVEQRARRIGGSGDGGVDGVIDQDALGLARIYVQANATQPTTSSAVPRSRASLAHYTDSRPTRASSSLRVASPATRSTTHGPSTPASSSSTATALPN